MTPTQTEEKSDPPRSVVRDKRLVRAYQLYTVAAENGVMDVNKKVHPKGTQLSEIEASAVQIQNWLKSGAVEMLVPSSRIAPLTPLKGGRA